MAQICLKSISYHSRYREISIYIWLKITPQANPRKIPIKALLSTFKIPQNTLKYFKIP
jgi:hypothetical protein